MIIIGASSMRVQCTCSMHFEPNSLTIYEYTWLFKFVYMYIVWFGAAMSLDESYKLPRPHQNHDFQRALEDMIRLAPYANAQPTTFKIRDMHIFVPIMLCSIIPNTKPIMLIVSCPAPFGSRGRGYYAHCWVYLCSQITVFYGAKLNTLFW